MVTNPYLPPLQTLMPAVGSYRPLSAGGGPAVPVSVTAIELSGVAQTPNGPVPFSRVQLDPSQTTLIGRCNCPLEWQVNPQLHRQAHPQPGAVSFQTISYLA